MQRAVLAPQQPPLPAGWQLYRDPQGHYFYWNQFTKQSSWTPPDQQQSLPPSSQPYNPAASQPYSPALYGSALDSGGGGALPPGWEQAVDSAGRTYYIDHYGKSTSWEDPRKSSANVNGGNRSGSTSISHSQSPPPSSGLYYSDAFPGLYGAPPSGASSSLGSSHIPIPVASSGGSNGGSGSYPEASPQWSAMNYGASQAPSNGGSVSLCVVKPTWGIEREGLKCCACGTEFTFFKRRHHCRCCFREFCDPCSTKRATVPQFGHTAQVRVCDSCSAHLKNGPQCLGKLVPYLEVGRPELEKAIEELYSLLVSLDIGIVEAVTSIGCLDLIMNLLQAPKGVNTGMMLELIQVLGKVSEDAEGLKIISGLNMKVFVDILNSANVECTTSMRIEITRILMRLTSLEGFKDSIREMGYIHPLLEAMGGSTNDDLLECTATLILTLIIGNEENTTRIGSDAVPALLILLSTKNTKLLESVVKILDVLAQSDSIKPIIDDVGGVEALMALLTKQDQKILTYVLKILHQLSSLEAACRSMASDTGIAALISFMSASDRLIQEPALGILINLSNLRDLTTIINRVVLYRGFQPLMKLLESAQTAIQRMILQLIYNIGADAQTQEMIRKADGISLIVSIILSQGDNLDLALQVLRVLINDCKPNCDALLDIGGMTVLVDLLPTSKEPAQLQSILCMCILASFNAGILDDFTSDTIQTLVLMFTYPNPELVTASINLLATVCGNNQCRAQIAATGGVTALGSLLALNDSRVQKQTIRLIGALTSSDVLEDPIRDSIGDLGCLPSILSALESGDHELQDVASFALKHCCRSFLNRIHIANMDALPRLVALLASSSKLAHINARIRLSEVIAAFTSEEKSRVSITEAGGVAVLIELIFSDEEQLKLNACMALSNCALDEGNLEEIHKLGGSLAFIPLLSSNNPSMQQSAIMGLGNLCRNSQCRAAILTPEVLNLLMGLLASPNDAVQSSSLWTITMLSSAEGFADIVQHTELGVKPLVDVLLGNSKDQLKQQTIFVIMNQKKESAFWQSFVSVGGVSGLFALVCSQNLEAQEQSMAELVKISEIQEKQDEILKDQNGLRAIAEFASSSTPTLSQCAVTIMSNLSGQQLMWPHIMGNLTCLIPLLAKQHMQLPIGIMLSTVSQQQDHLQLIVASGILPILIELLFSNDTELLNHVVNVIANLSVSEEFAEKIHSYGGVLGLITLLNHKHERIQESVIHALCNVARVSHTCRETIIGNDGLEPIIPLLSSGKFQQQALFIVGLLSLNDKFCSAIQKQGGLPPLVKILAESEKVETRLQVLDTLINISWNGSSNRVALVSAGILAPLFRTIQHGKDEVEHEKAIEVIANLVSDDSCQDSLQEQGGLEVVSNLLLVQNPNILVQATKALSYLSMRESSREILASQPGTPLLLPLLASETKQVVLNAAKTVDLLLFCDPLREKFQEGGLISFLVNLVRSRDADLQSAAMWVLRNLFLIDKTGELFRENHGIAAVVQLLKSNDSLVMEALRLLCNLVPFDANRKLIRESIQMELSSLERHSNPCVKELFQRLRISLG